jgi:phosphopantothenoylcysteine decarboxylase/phosphopantothenate--cysteine ligase
MRCIVTAGPTYEPLDNVRRLTNFSTGRLGTELARFLEAREHEVTLLLGEQATYREGSAEIFTTTSDLRERLRRLASQQVNAVFHAAAVSDFGFGKVWARSAQGEMKEVKSGKFSTREGTLLAELLPTPKVIAELRQWLPMARLVGWKYEVDGTREDVIREAEKQLAACLTDACVANGPAYGEGFGLVQGAGEFKHLENKSALFEALAKFVTG